MKRLLPLLLLGLPVSAFAHADLHAGHTMPGMAMPDAKPTDSQAEHEAQPAEDDGEASSEEAQPLGTDQPPGSAETPPVSHERAADRYYDPAAMAKAEKVMMRPPLTRYAKLLIDQAEYQSRQGRDGYRWEGEAWIGDLNRFVVKSEGEGTFGKDVDRAEVRALYAKALDPWWNAEVGLRQDFGSGRDRTWATVAIDGRAPYQFDAEGALFLSDKGQFAARLEGSYDQRITQRLVLQPRLELNFAAQDMPEQRIGAGLSRTELGLRLRYEIRREFAPYLGVSWSWSSGRTADYARADGDDPSEGSLVAGVRVWF